jgi:hypothetical protein
MFVLDQLVAQGLFGIGGSGGETGRAIDHVADQVESIEVIEYAQTERRGDRAFFLVTAGN